MGPPDESIDEEVIPKSKRDIVSGFISSEDIGANIPRRSNRSAMS